MKKPKINTFSSLKLLNQSLPFQSDFISKVKRDLQGERTRQGQGDLRRVRPRLDQVVLRLRLHQRVVLRRLDSSGQK